MVVKFTSVLLIVVLVAMSSSTSCAEEAAQQSLSEMRRVANTAMEKGKQLNVTLRGKKDGKKKLSGMPSNVSEQGFSMADAKSGQVSRLEFEDIREVRVKPSHVWLGVGIAIAAAAAIVVLVALNSALSKD